MCLVNFLLESSNKGFEGAHVFTGWRQVLDWPVQR
jgi:hypothetical protein